MEEGQSMDRADMGHRPEQPTDETGKRQRADTRRGSSPQRPGEPGQDRDRSRSQDQQPAPAPARSAGRTRGETQPEDDPVRGQTKSVMSPHVPPSPLVSGDIAAALQHLQPWDLAFLLRGPSHLAGFTELMAQGGSRTTRSPGQPDAGASQEVDFGPSGLRVRIITPREIREGAMTWRQVATWLTPGLTPLRRQIFDHADRSALTRPTPGLASHGGGLDRRQEDLLRETSRIVATSVATTIGAALQSREPGPHTDEQSGSQHEDREALERLKQLLAIPPEVSPASITAEERALANQPSDAGAFGQENTQHGQPVSATALPVEDRSLDAQFEGVIDVLTEHGVRQAVHADSQAAAFADIRAAFAELRQALDLPPEDGFSPSADTPRRAGPADEFARLDDALAEARACANWYRDAPEWERIGTVTEAARALMTAIRNAAGDYWAEVRQDIRVRGFTRTVAARTARTISHAADALARRLADAGHGHTYAWKAAMRLHAAATSASRVISYPAASAGRMDQTAGIIAGLQQSKRAASCTDTVHADRNLGRHARAPKPVAAARASYPGPWTRALAAPRMLARDSRHSQVATRKRQAHGHHQR
jgi:hypothetical protein